MYLVVDEKCKNNTPNKNYLNANKDTLVNKGFRVEKQVKIKGRKKQKSVLEK